MRCDVVVLGAGMVGVSAALHLQARGRDVVLLDRHGHAAGETSYGNAGLIERASYFPYVFPRDFETVWRSIAGRNRAARIVWRDLPWTLPFIARYFHQSAPARAMRHARASWPLIERSLAEHDALAAQADATHLLRREGWIKGFRTERTLAAGLAEADRVRALGMRVDVLDVAALSERESHIAGPIGAVHYRDPVSCVDPGGLAQAYADLFTARGGRLMAGDARTLERTSGGWRVRTIEGPVEAEQVLVALGPWSGDLCAALGVQVPLGVKRGYHRHFGAAGNAVLNRPFLDADEGYLLAPMAAGIRLTTGAEFARRDRAPSSAQINSCEAAARRAFPLGERREERAWLGCRPCLPDLLPVIGPAPGQAGLWLDFGHQHHGFTLGPVTGRLVAEMMTGETPFADPTPYRADRFCKSAPPRSRRQRVRRGANLAQVAPQAGARQMRVDLHVAFGAQLLFDVLHRCANARSGEGISALQQGRRRAGDAAGDVWGDVKFSHRNSKETPDGNRGRTCRPALTGAAQEEHGARKLPPPT